MHLNRWISTFIVASIVGLIINLPIAKGESRDMNQEDGKVQQKFSEQTEQEILEYWTPERMQNAKPIMPTIPETLNLVPQLQVPQSQVEESASPPVSELGSAMEEQGKRIKIVGQIVLRLKG